MNLSSAGYDVRYQDVTQESAVWGQDPMPSSKSPAELESNPAELECIPAELRFKTRRSSSKPRRSSCQKYEKIMKNIGNFNEFYISFIPYCERIFRIRSELRRGLFELRRVLIPSSAGFNLSSAGLLDDGTTESDHSRGNSIVKPRAYTVVHHALQDWGLICFK